MHNFKRLVALLALLSAACSPSMLAQRPTPTPTLDSAATQESATGEAVPPTSAITADLQDTAEIATDVPTPATVSTPVAPTPIAAAQVATRSSVAPAASTPVTSTPVTSTPVTSTAATVAAAQSQANAQGEAYENLASPVDLLASYFNAVELQEYERAYSYWQQPPLEYEAFASGYADTATVQLIVQPPTRIEGAAGSLYAAIPTFLIARHHDGSVHSFAGCMVTRKSNLASPDTAEADAWHIYQARLGEVANNSNIAALLASACAS
jgi:hypothetical protein